MKTQDGYHYAESPVHVIVRVLQDMIAVCPFESYADLADELKWRCAKLKIPYDGGLISDAIARLEAGGRKPIIFLRDVVASVPVPPARTPEPPLTRAAAAKLIEQLKVRINEMPATPLAPRGRKLSNDSIVKRIRDRERLKALRMVQQEIVDTVARTEELEQRALGQTTGNPDGNS